MKRAVSLFLFLGLILSNQAFANTTLKAIMKDLGTNAKQLNTQLKATPPDTSDMTAVQALQRLSLEMLAETPDKVANLPAGDNKRLQELEYQKFTLKLATEYFNAEEDMINGKASQALDHLKESFKIRNSAHALFQ